MLNRENVLWHILKLTLKSWLNSPRSDGDSATKQTGEDSGVSSSWVTEKAHHLRFSQHA